MGYIDDLKLKVANLEHDHHIKDAEIRLLLDDRVDTLRPSIAMSEMTLIIIQMLIENNEFMQKHGANKKAQISKERLVKLLDLNQEFDTIAIQNSGLKSTNRFLHSQNQLLRVEKVELQKQINIYHATSQEL